MNTKEIQSTEFLRQELSATRQSFQSDTKHIWCIAAISTDTDITVCQSVRKSLPLSARMKMTMALLRFLLALN